MRNRNAIYFFNTKILKIDPLNMIYYVEPCIGVKFCFWVHQEGFLGDLSRKNCAAFFFFFLLAVMNLQIISVNCIGIA